MNVSQIMNFHVVTSRPESNLSEAAGAMWDHDVGCLPVVDPDGRVVGMITDRDIAMAGYTQGCPLTDILVASAMSREVYACLESDSLLIAEDVMRSRRVRRLPVLDAKGYMRGMLSLNDLAIEAERQQGRQGRELSAQEVASTLAAVCEPRRNRVLAIRA